MKSARGRDRSGMPVRTATSRSGWRRRGYTTGREGHSRRPTFRLRFPEGPRVRAAERVQDAARSRQTRSPCSPEWGGRSPASSSSQRSTWSRLIPAYLRREQLAFAAPRSGLRPRRPMRSATWGHRHAWDRRPVRFGIASPSPSVQLRGPCRGPPRSRVLEAGGSAGLRARVGGEIGRAHV